MRAGRSPLPGPEFNLRPLAIDIRGLALTDFYGREVTTMSHGVAEFVRHWTGSPSIERHIWLLEDLVARARSGGIEDPWDDESLTISLELRLGAGKSYRHEMWLSPAHGWPSAASTSSTGPGRPSDAPQPHEEPTQHEASRGHASGEAASNSSTDAMALTEDTTVCCPAPTRPRSRSCSSRSSSPPTCSWPCARPASPPAAWHDQHPGRPYA